MREELSSAGFATGSRKRSRPSWRCDAGVEPQRASYHLHGGATGFSQQRWHVIAQASDSVTLGLESLDGHEGYPGNLSVRARYSVKGATLRLDFTATSDAPTLVNLCHHAYFSLSREQAMDDHPPMASPPQVSAGRCRSCAYRGHRFRLTTRRLIFARPRRLRDAHGSAQVL
ncbi:MAG: hypothetical protein IPI73_09220, partial [Betaproteobacteria bacterium]|nr:hypothetical protein [Betaproteobacteria bacterium]